jgi:hypothetical protein
MKLFTIIAVAISVVSLAFGQAKLPYDMILKASAIRKPIEIDGKAMIRIWVKSNDEKTKREDVVFSLVRGDTVLSVIHPEVADYSGLKNDSSAREYPWQILVPFGTEFSDCTLDHNQPKGSIHLGFTSEFHTEDGKIKIQDR